ncbi:MAG: hypothetical protein ACK5LR_11815 [Mangrovibacterium sp.]
MKHLSAYFHPQAKHFNRWSRKNYALFSVLGCVVHIGRLSMRSAQWVGEIFQHVSEELQETLRMAAEEEEEATAELGEWLVVAVATDEVCGARSFTQKAYIYNNSNTKPLVG